MDERPIQVSHALGYDLSGHALDDRYQITRKIGTGGMAVVYEARRIGLDRRFAIKILRPELAEQESNVKRFLREARSAAAIEHINIVSIVDVGESSRPVYFVMEYLDGVDLRHIIRTQGRQQWPRTRERGLQIVGALAAAHARGIVHRDVKPANCFLVRDDSGRERVKVLDFGIAKVLEESQDYTNVTATHGIVGTVAYMAPEQARSGTVDKRTDVYALGTMLYEMLAGTVPFPDKNPFVALSRQLAEPPRPLREHRPDLSPEVEAIVMTCLAKDPDERFQSMEALGGALEAVAGDPVVWTGPMIAAPVVAERGQGAAPSGSAPVAHDHAHAQPFSVAPSSGGMPTDPGTLGAIGPAVRTDVLPAMPTGARTEAATPTFPLPVPDAGAPVAHGREAAAPMSAAIRSSADVPIVPGSRPVSGAAPMRASARPASAPVRATAQRASASTPAPAPHGVAGLIVGALGMLALGGTVTWWALQRSTTSDAAEPVRAIETDPRPAVESAPHVEPQHVEPTPTDTAAPHGEPPPIEPTPIDPAPDATGQEPRLGEPHPRPRPRHPLPSDPKPPPPDPDPDPPPDPKTTADGGADPDVAPGLRNPFPKPKPKPTQ